jgi:hypothetical protein
LRYSLLSGSILTVLALSIIGCDPADPLPEQTPKHEEEHAASKQGPPSPAPPVDPSRTPSIPASANPEPKADEKKADEKKVDALK